MLTKDFIELEEKYGAHNYHPLDVVIDRAEGVWVYDVEGNKYLDCLAAYSAVNQGHCHPRIVKALKDQAEKVTLTSRAFRNDQLPFFYKEVCELTGYTAVLPMNSGAEGVETALKAARKWGYKIKGIEGNSAEIITCSNNFAGRTISVISFSSVEQYKEGFGPFTPGFKIIEFGNSEALEKAITKNTVAFLVEPIQGEGGVIVPPDGYLKKAFDICKKNNVLFIADEIQSGLGRSGKLFAFENFGIIPDMVVLGKGLGGGIMPLAALLTRESLNVGGHMALGHYTHEKNPVSCAAGLATLEVILEERLPERAAELGAYALEQLRKMAERHPLMADVRGLGLLLGVELSKVGPDGTFQPAVAAAERVMYESLKRGLNFKVTMGNVLTLTPALTISRTELDLALKILDEAIAEAEKE